MRSKASLRLMLCGTVASVLVTLATPAAIAQESTTYKFDIPAQDLDAALRTYARASGQQISFDGDAVKGKTSAPLEGSYTADDALRTLLGKNGLYMWRGPAGVLMVSTTPSPTKLGDASRASPSERNMEEIIVTAQKRSERLQDVPLPVTAVSGQSLIDNGPLRIQDYYNQIPGLNMTPALSDQNDLSIRGVTTGQGGNRTVGFVVDDVSYGADINYAGGAVLPDIDPDDVARIEVLRGPQGTLYGASSIGGLLKFVTKSPSTEEYTGSVQAGMSSVRNGAELGYNFRASVNAPISETLAVRASGFTRQDPGYIDNIVTGRTGVNESHTSGVHVSALWRLSDAFSLKLSALYQEFNGDGVNEVQPQYGDLKQAYVAGVGRIHKTVEAYSGTLTTQLAGIDVISITGYNRNRDTNITDNTEFFGANVQQHFGVTGSPFVAYWPTDRFSQEVRFSSTVGKFEWLIGAFYTYEDALGLYQDGLATTPAGEVVGTYYHIPFPSTYAEYAVFGDLTYHVTDRFDVQIGGRESRNRQTLEETFVGPYVPDFLLVPSPLVEPEQRSSEHAFTYLVTPRFKVSPDLMVYARIASGFRPGSPNLNGVAISARSDTTVNYEVGLKGDFLDHRLSIDTSLYYIDWSNIQITLVQQPSQLAYLANGSGAKSEGVELSVSVRPLSGLTIAGWIAYDEAVLTEPFPPAATIAEPAGARLPDAPRFTGNFSIDDDFPITGSVTGSVGGTVIYVGNRLGVFTNPRSFYPSYTQINLRAGVEYDSWRLRVCT